MARGIVHWTSAQGRYGFIRDGARRSFFFHQSSLADGQNGGHSHLFDTLVPGTPVHFSEVVTPRGLRAEDLRLVDDGGSDW